MKKLTSCEQEIMLVIWQSSGEIAESRIREDLFERLGKKYARTTIATFLKKMEEKGYLEKYRVGRKSYVRPLISSGACIREELQTMLADYYGGDKGKFAEDFRMFVMQ